MTNARLVLDLYSYKQQIFQISMNATSRETKLVEDTPYVPILQEVIGVTAQSTTYSLPTEKTVRVS